MIEPVLLGRIVPLKYNKKGEPLLVEMPLRVQAMECAADDLFHTLGQLTLSDLQALAPTARYSHLIEALIAVRHLMGGDGSDT